jgi:hypothetical protein
MSEVVNTLLGIGDAHGEDASLLGGEGTCSLHPFTARNVEI